MYTRAWFVELNAMSEEGAASVGPCETRMREELGIRENDERGINGPRALARRVSPSILIHCEAASALKRCRDKKEVAAHFFGNPLGRLYGLRSRESLRELESFRTRSKRENPSVGILAGNEDANAKFGRIQVCAYFASFARRDSVDDGADVTTRQDSRNRLLRIGKLQTRFFS